MLMRPVNFKRLMPAFVMLATPIVLADAREEGAQEPIDAMVVTATRSNALVRDQPIRVEVVPKEEVEENLTIQPGNLSTLLNELAGVHVQTVAPSLGGARLQLRGLPGRHTVVLQDRLPLLGAETDAFGLLQTPPLDLQRVELIKGAASALYGGSALGGVLNLVSRPPGSEPEVLVNRTSRGGTDLVGFVPASLPSEWGFTLTGGAHDQTTEDIDHDGWADLPAYRRYTLRPRVFYRDGDERSLLGTVGFVDEDRDGGTLDGRSLADGTVFPESLHTRRLDGGAVGDFKLNDGRRLSAQGSVTRTEHDRVFGATGAHDTETTAYGEATLTGSDTGHAWVLGAAFAYDRLDTDDAPGVGYSYAVPAIFAQDEFSPSDFVTLAGSARIDVHSAYGTFVSPRFSALFRAGEEWSLRASIATGFAAPTPFLDEIEATSLTVLEPLRNLHAERAVSASLDAKWAAGGWEIDGSVFESVIRDPLEVQASFQPGHLELFNADGPRRAYGAEMLLGYIAGPLHVIGNYTFLHVTEAAPGGGREAAELVPRTSAEVAGILEDEERGRIGVEISYTGPQALAENPYRTESESFVEINVLAEMRFGPVAVFLNAVNLTDVRQTHFDPLLRPGPGPGGDPITAVWAPLAGRTFNLGIRAEL